MPPPTKKRRLLNEEIPVGNFSQLRNNNRKASRNTQEPGSQTEKKSSQLLEKLSEEENQKLVADLVRYILFCDSARKPINRKGMNEMLGSYSKYLTALLEPAIDKLKAIFGYDLVEIQKIDPKTGRKQKGSKSGVYLLRNLIKNPKRIEYFSKDVGTTQETGLLMITVSLVFLHQKVDEDALFSHLKRLGFHSKQPHDTYGDWEKLITTKWPRLHYLVRRKVNGRQSESGGILYEYTLGQRTEQEIGNAKIHTFVAEQFGQQVDEADTKALEESSVSSGSSGSSGSESESESDG